MKIFKSIRAKIFSNALLIVILSMLISSVVNFNFMEKIYDHNFSQMRQILQEDYDTKIKHQVELAISSLRQLDKSLIDKGMKDKTDRKTILAELLRNMRYGEDGYFWADTPEGDNVVILGRSSEGKNRMDLQDTKGQYIVQNIIAAGLSNGGGYTDYYFPRKEGGQSFRKRSYSLHFPEYD